MLAVEVDALVGVSAFEPARVERGGLLNLLFFEQRLRDVLVPVLGD